MVLLVQLDQHFPQGNLTIGVRGIILGRDADLIKLIAVLSGDKGTGIVGKGHIDGLLCLFVNRHLGFSRDDRSTTIGATTGNQSVCTGIGEGNTKVSVFPHCCSQRSERIPIAVKDLYGSTGRDLTQAIQCKGLGLIGHSCITVIAEIGIQIRPVLGITIEEYHQIIILLQFCGQTVSCGIISVITNASGSSAPQLHDAQAVCGVFSSIVCCAVCAVGFMDHHNGIVDGDLAVLICIANTDGQFGKFCLAILRHSEIAILTYQCKNCAYCLGFFGSADTAHAFCVAVNRMGRCGRSHGAGVTQPVIAGCDRSGTATYAGDNTVFIHNGNRRVRGTPLPGDALRLTAADAGGHRCQGHLGIRFCKADSGCRVVISVIISSKPGNAGYILACGIGGHNDVVRCCGHTVSGCQCGLQNHRQFVLAAIVIGLICGSVVFVVGCSLIGFRCNVACLQPLQELQFGHCSTIFSAHPKILRLGSTVFDSKNAVLSQQRFLGVGICCVTGAVYHKVQNRHIAFDAILCGNRNSPCRNFFHHSFFCSKFRSGSLCIIL